MSGTERVSKPCEESWIKIQVLNLNGHRGTQIGGSRGSIQHCDMRHGPHAPMFALMRPDARSHAPGRTCTTPNPPPVPDASCHVCGGMEMLRMRTRRTVPPTAESGEAEMLSSACMVSQRDQCQHRRRREPAQAAPQSLSAPIALGDRRESITPGTRASHPAPEHHTRHQSITPARSSLRRTRTSWRAAARTPGRQKGASGQTWAPPARCPAAAAPPARRCSPRSSSATRQAALRPQAGDPRQAAKGHETD